MPELDFMANMNISPYTVKNLREKGWNIVRVSELMDAGSKDIEILKYAREHNKVLITQDLDFSALLAVGGYEKPSIINLRLENARPDYVTNRIIATVSELEKELELGIIVRVDEVSARYKSLPIDLNKTK